MSENVVPLGKLFTVIDSQTGNEPDLEQIALKEDWAKGLMYCDMDGFVVDEDGDLCLLDECGNYAYPPEGRFGVVYSNTTNASLRSTLQSLERQLDAAKGLLEMSQSLVPKRERSCKETKCIVCGMRDEYHARVSTFLSEAQ